VFALSNCPDYWISIKNISFLEKLFIRKIYRYISYINKQTFIGFEVLTPVVMKSSIFWDTTPHSPLKVNRLFGGTSLLHLQGRKICQARNQLATCFHAAFLLLIFFDPEDGGDMFLRNVG
jgi:hypothetical protein